MGDCTTMPANCWIPDYDDPSQCYYCADGMTALSNGNCGVCTDLHADCLTCDNVGTCSECSVGVPTADGTSCQPTIDNCMTHTDATNKTCLTCDSGYTANPTTGRCIDCTAATGGGDVASYTVQEATSPGLLPIEEAIIDGGFSTS